MCGIAGYSLSPSSRVERTLAAQALLAAIAERGADAVGYAWRGNGEAPVTIHKQRTGASALLEEIHVPGTATQALIHVRDYTKGHPTIAANNHPIRHGAVVGVHNGIIVNDEEIFAERGFQRAEPEMTVDSEAIFALAEDGPADAATLEALRGSMATAWLDERRPEVVFAARGVGRPLWLGWGKHEAFFASTREALEVVERYARMTLTKREVDEGTLVALEGGRVAWSERFTPDRAFEENPLPPVRAPHEGDFCLKLLAGLASL
jgi:glucosamine 6-phosphate synthetase-like amidotransferase/phosphosugar isomerase protein